MINVVSILSLAHSGSTLLDLILGTAPNCVGLGQINTVIREDVEGIEKRLCSCRQYAFNCGFWSKYLAKIKSNIADTDKKKLQILLNTFRENFGENAVVVDSSKSMKFVDQLRELDFVRVKTVHLIKDVRSYTVSQFNNISRKGRDKNGIFGDTLKAFLFFRRWYKKNRALEELMKGGLEHMKISYEELCLYPGATFRRMEEFCGLENGALNQSLQQSSSHIISGNRMRNLEEKTDQIRYDYRWLSSDKWVIPYVFYRKVRQYNVQTCYTENHSNFYSKEAF